MEKRMKQRRTAEHSYGLQESAMRPSESYREWLQILEQELPQYFSRGLVRVPCVGCGNKRSKPAFVKFGFTYEQCAACHTIFASPRPTEKSIGRFHASSRASKFWKERIISPTADVRQAHQIEPLQAWARSIVKHQSARLVHALDYDQKSPPIWNNAFVSHFPALARLSVTSRAFVKSTPLAKKVSLDRIRAGSVDLITALDVLDRAPDPKHTIKTFASLCRRGGVLLLTTNTGSGFEYLVLGAHSPRLVPPDRLNLLTVEAITNLLMKHGFELRDVSTPGKLDVQVVRKAWNENPELAVGPFLEHLFRFRSALALESFQNFLQLNSMSAYLRIAAVKT